MPRKEFYPDGACGFSTATCRQAILPRRDLIVTREDQQNWSVAMRCPCGCGDMIELLVVPEARPSWSLSIDCRGRPSLSPSVWRRTGCQTHSGYGRVE